MVLLVLPKLVAGLSPEGGETETKCRCYICVSHFLVPWVPVMPSCLVSPFCLHVPSLHETHVYQVCSPQPVMSLLTCLSSPMTVSMFAIIHTHAYSQYRT